jgi:glucokinase
VETDGRDESFRAGMIAGIDLGGTLVRVAFADETGRVRFRAQTRTATLGGPRRVVAWIVEQVRCYAPGGPLAGAAIGAPGPVDPDHGVLINPPNLGDPRAWHNLPLADMLRDALGCDVHLENDANLAALGEFRQGAGRDVRHMVYLTWSTGVGGGLIMDGRLHSGAHGSAGEIGHMVLDPHGPVCGCGQRGCVEALCSGANIARQYGESAAELLRAAADGDPQAEAIVRQLATWMGLALINLANIFDPELFVIGGGYTRSWSQLRPQLEEVLKASPFVKPRRRPKLRRAQLGDRVGEIGAVEWARAWL